MRKQILNLAYPAIISNITVPLVGLVDIALVGRLGSAAYIGGVGFASIVFSFIYSGLGFLRMSTNGLTAQAYGASNFREANSILVRAVILGVFSGLLLIVLQVPLEKLLISVFNSSPESLKYASEYFYVRIYATPASLSVIAFMGWFVGMQDTKTPMWLTLIISIANIVFSLLFVVYFQMGIKGVALGTVIAQYLGLVSSILFYFKKYKSYSLFINKNSILKFDKIKRFFNISKDIFIRSILLTGSFFLFNIVSADFGDDILALNSVMLQFLWFFAYFADGFANAGGSIAGKYKGAKNLKLLNETIKESLRLGFHVAIAFTLIYVVFSKQFINILTDSAKVIILFETYGFWVWLIPLTGFAAFIYDGIYIGITESKIMRNLMIFSILIVFVPLLFIAKLYLGNHGMWAVLILMLLTRGIGLKIYIKKAVEIKELKVKS